MADITYFFQDLHEATPPLLDVNVRLGRLQDLLRAILAEQKAIEEALQKDLGKPGEEADFTELVPVAAELRAVIRQLPRWSKPQTVKSSPLHFTGRAWIHRQPKGRVLILSPWNYPFNLCISPLVSAIAAGNRVVLKPSEFTPHTAAVVRRLIERCFSPKEVMLAEGGADVAAELTAMPFNHIFFTGSPAVGKKVMAAAAQNLASVTLELGGKSPFIIDATADIQKTARRLVWGKSINCGQTCIAPDYVMLHESVAYDLLKACKEELHQRFPKAMNGTPEPESYARIVHEGHFDRLRKMLDDAREQGASLIAGGHYDKEQLFMSPTILLDEGKNDALLLMKEEIFGPLLPVRLWSKEQEVYDAVAARPHPLSVYAFSSDKEFLGRCRERISTGGFVVNDVLSHYVHPHLPFGGINNSGIGRAHGEAGFREFSNEVSVLESGPGPAGAELFATPYTKIKRLMIEKALKYL
ncbi:MAG: aldehyde dehydrogenase family protein [Cyclonatronaceae bacterium]